MKKTIFALLFLVLLFTMPAAMSEAGEGDAILGIWYTPDKEAKVRINNCADKYCGVIVWVAPPTVEARQKFEKNNPGKTFDPQAAVGTKLLRDFAYAGGNVYKDGKVFARARNKEYKGKLTLIDANKLKVKVIVNFAISKTLDWTRVKE